MKTLFRYSIVSFNPPPPPTPQPPPKKDTIPLSLGQTFCCSQVPLFLVNYSDWLTKEIPHVLVIYIVLHLPLKGLCGYK